MKDSPTSSIYILLTDTGSLLSNIIKFFTGAPYNHASLSFKEDLSETYSFGRKNLLNPLFAGMVREEVLNGVYERFSDTDCAILKLDVSEECYILLKEKVNKLYERRESYAYNFLGLIGVALNVPITRKEKYFCSQFVSEILRVSHINLFNKPDALVSPYDFYTHPELEVLYEGKLLNYPHIHIAYDCALSVTKHYSDYDLKSDI